MPLGSDGKSYLFGSLRFDDKYLESIEEFVGRKCSLQILDRESFDIIGKKFTLNRIVLYVTALTERDWLENCDQRRTDPDVHLRSAAVVGILERIGGLWRPLGFLLRAVAALGTNAEEPIRSALTGLST